VLAGGILHNATTAATATTNKKVMESWSHSRYLASWGKRGLLMYLAKVSFVNCEFETSHKGQGKMDKESNVG
jgi:hypothetical protein